MTEFYNFMVNIKNLELVGRWSGHFVKLRGKRWTGRYFNY